MVHDVERADFAAIPRSIMGKYKGCKAGGDIVTGGFPEQFLRPDLGADGLSEELFFRTKTTVDVSHVDLRKSCDVAQSGRFIGMPGKPGDGCIENAFPGRGGRLYSGAARHERTLDACWQLQ